MRFKRSTWIVFGPPLLVLLIPVVLGFLNPAYFRPFGSKAGLLVVGFALALNLLAFFLLHTVVSAKTLHLALKICVGLLIAILLVMTLSLYILGPAALLFVQGGPY